MDRVLIIEDDREICEILEYYLTRDQRYAVTVAHSAEAALPLVKEKAFDCILLDIMLPGLDGISFCMQLRKRIYCPILFISCLDDDETIIQAMNMGGDDYLVKPFSCSVLMAYVDANIRRSRMRHPEESVLKSGFLRLDPSRHSVQKHGETVILSPTEYEILHYMMRHKGEFMAFESIYKSVWDSPSGGDVRTLFTHVGNLRKKLEDDPREPVYILTHQRSGYVFSDLPPEDRR